jgi:hypothetical protein
MKKRKPGLLDHIPKENYLGNGNNKNEGEKQ